MGTGMAWSNKTRMDVDYDAPTGALPTLRPANSITVFTCSRFSPSYHSMMLSRLAPASRFSKMAETGMRVPFRTQAPLTLPGTLSTAEQLDQSRFAMANSSTPPPRIPFWHKKEKRKRPHSSLNMAFINAGNDLLSHTLSRAVQSALRGLTSVFGMGTGGTPAVRSPTSVAAVSY